MRIGELAKQSGVSVATLRAWERRYGLPRPTRTASGQRLYSEDDLQQIIALRALSERGWSLAAAAAAVQSGTAPDLAQEQPSARAVTPLPSRLHGRLLEVVREAVIVTDLEAVITYWNAAAERIYGWRAEEVVGRNVVDVVVDPAGRDEATAIMRELRAGRFTSRELDLMRRDGTVFHAHIVNDGLWDGSTLVGFVGASWDLTERDENARVGQLRTAELESIAVLGLRRSRAIGPERIMEEAVRTVRRVLGADCVAVYIRKVDGLGLRAVASGGRGRRPVTENHDALAQHAVAIERPVISNSLRSERRFDTTALIEHGLASAIAVPIPALSAPRGALMVVSATERTFSAEDANYLQAIANIICSAHDMEAMAD